MPRLKAADGTALNCTALCLTVLRRNQSGAREFR
jgi:hypothetical protein